VLLLALEELAAGVKPLLSRPHFMLRHLPASRSLALDRRRLGLFA
jgi:hypothetical protein